MTSVPLDVETHAKVCGAAALKRVDRTAFLSEIITEHMRGVVLIDKRKPVNRDNDSNRASGASEASSDEEIAA